jgi:RHS repeat-associated protein
MPIEFIQTQQPTGSSSDNLFKQTMSYDGAGRRISKTSLHKNVNSDDWTLEQITHYTGIGSEIRKEYHNGELQSTKVVVNMPQGLGRYGIENADGMAKGDEFYLKNHLGSTMMVAQVSSTNASEPAKVAAAYDYRAFGEQVTLTKSADKVTENFTGKEKDDETELNYFGARYLDPMLGMWTSVDPARQFASPYLYAGNGMNPIGAIDPDGNFVNVIKNGNNLIVYVPVCFTGNESYKQPVINAVEKNLSGKFGKYTVSTQVVEVPYSERENANMVALLDGNERSEVRNFGTQESQADIYMKNADDTYAAVHEFAHLLGLDDRYTNNDDGTSSAHKGYGANLMGVHGEYGIKEEQIEEIFKGPGSAGNYIDE